MASLPPLCDYPSENKLLVFGEIYCAPVRQEFLIRESSALKDSYEVVDNSESKDINYLIEGKVVSLRNKRKIKTPNGELVGKTRTTVKIGSKEAFFLDAYRNVVAVVRQKFVSGIPEAHIYVLSTPLSFNSFNKKSLKNISFDYRLTAKNNRKYGDVVNLSGQSICGIHRREGLLKDSFAVLVPKNVDAIFCCLIVTIFDDMF